MNLREPIKPGDLWHHLQSGGSISSWVDIQEARILHEARLARAQEGIRPLAKSKMADLQGLTGQLWITPVQGIYDFTLPGNGLAYVGDDYGEACGSILRLKTLGCLEAQDHNVSGLDFDHSGFIFIKLASRTCFRAECPVCYESWVGKLAGRVEQRILNFILENSPRSKAIHFIASVPKSQWGWVGSRYGDLRRMAYKLAMRSGLRGGVIVFHPFRYACFECGGEKPEGRKICPKCGSGSFSWYFSPHFHMIGLGWIEGVKEINRETGWVLKNLGVRESIFRTAQYILSHCGIHDGHHATVWFGVMGYRNYKAPRMKAEKPKCPICDRVLQSVAWAGVGDWPIPQPEKARGYYLEAREGWVYVGYNLVGH